MAGLLKKQGNSILLVAAFSSKNFYGFLQLIFFINIKLNNDVCPFFDTLLTFDKFIVTFNLIYRPQNSVWN